MEESANSLLSMAVHGAICREEHMSDTVGIRPCKGSGFSFLLFIFMMSSREAVLLSHVRNTYVYILAR